MKRLTVGLVLLMSVLVPSFAVADSWVLWTHVFHAAKPGKHIEAQWMRSAAFPDQDGCLAELQRRHTDQLARQCHNIGSGAVIPNCGRVEADGSAGLKFYNKDGSQTSGYLSCWPATVDPRH